MDQQFSLRWNNYLNQITNAFDSLKNEEDLVDVTLSCEGKKLKAHKMLLSACSPYFRDIFKDNPCQHPVIVFRNFKFVDLEAVIDFMYKGEVDVKQEHFESFLGTAELLEVKGLTEGSGRTNNVEEDSDASKTYGSEIDQPSHHLAAELTRSTPTKKRKCQSSISDKAKTSEKKQKSTVSNIPLIPKIENEELLEDIEDLTFDDGDTDDSHSTNADLSQVPSGHSLDYNIGSSKHQLETSMLPKGLVHTPEPGSSVELTPDIMQTEGIVVQSEENDCYITSEIPVKVEGDSKTEERSTSCDSKQSLSDTGANITSNNPVDKTKTMFNPTNSESVERNFDNQKQRFVSNTLHEKVLNSKALNLPQGLIITMKEGNPTRYDSNQTAEHTALRSEKAKTPIQEESLSNQEQMLEVSSDSLPGSNQLTLDEPEMAEEAPNMISEEFVSEGENQDVVEEKLEPEFDYFGCETCKADQKPVDKYNLVLTHKCPICPCVCFCAHLLKEHMKVIHGWFNVQRRFKQY